MHYKLKFTNPWGEVHWFCNLGSFWGAGDTRRLIERTTTQPAQAREFSAVEEARETLTISGNGIAVPDEHGVVKGWQVVDESGRAVE